jgi:DNA repair protein RadD
VGGLTLRPYQERAIACARDHVRRGVRRVLICAPTGAGKTVVGGAIILSAVERRKRALFVAHRRELIRQSFCKLVRGGLPPDQVGVIMGDTPHAELELRGLLAPELPDTDAELWSRYARRRPSAPVQVASIDTLRRREKPPADLVGIDECHRALSKSYMDLLEHYGQATHFGLTATPFRADGRGLGDAYEQLVVVTTIRELIDEGYLVEPLAYGTKELPDLSKVKRRGGDYDQEELAEACDKRELVGNIVEHWLEHADGRRTVCFAASVQHSRHIVEQFLAAGVAAEHIDGETPTEERDAILARVDSGETLVVSNYGVLCEGWDQPSVKVCILARPTKSEGLYLQMCGRILRPWNGVPALILDHAGCANDFWLPQDPREFSLEGRKKRTEALPSVRACHCLATLPRGARVCPACGDPVPAAAGGGGGRAEPEHVDGELVALTSSVGDGDARHVLAAVKAWHKRWERGNPTKPGWVAYDYQKRAGRRWPRGVPLPVLTPAQQLALEEHAERRAIQEERGYSPAWLFAGRKGRDDGMDAITPAQAAGFGRVA